MTFISLDRLSYFLDKVKALIPTQTSELTNDSGYITAEDVPTAPIPGEGITNDSGIWNVNVVHVYTNVEVSAADAVADSTYDGFAYYIDLAIADAGAEDVPICAWNDDNSVYTGEWAYAGDGYVRVWVSNKSFGTAYLNYLALLRPPAAG